MNDIIGRLPLLPLLCALAVPIAAASAQNRNADAPVVTGELGEKLDRYLSRLSAFGMAGTVLVAKDGRIVIHKGYGSVDRSTGAPIVTSTPFLIGSLSKQFTAAAILKLEMQGKLSTGDTLGRFFPNAPKEKAGITIHQLLTHTSGLPYLSRNMFEAKSRARAIEEMLELPMQSAPGEEYAYSNPGYTLLGGVIEKASGESYESYLTRNILIPAGMTATGFTGDTARWGDAPTHSYSGNNDEGKLIDFPNSEEVVGPGSIVATAGDLYKWELALRGGTILSAAAREKFFAPHVQAGPGSYAYGWNVTKTIRGTTLIVHAGDIGGYNAEYRRYVDEDLVVIFTSNVRVNGAGFRQAVMNPISLLVSGRDVPMPPEVAQVPADRLRKYGGRYTLPTGGTLRAWIEDGTMMVGAEDQAAISAMSGAVPKDSASQAFLTGRAIEIVRAASRGDFEPLRASLHPSIALDGAKEGLVREWIGYRDSLGALREIEPIGTALLSQAMAESYYRLRFERGDLIGMYGWTGGKVTAIENGITGIRATSLLPESERALVSFDPFSGRTLRVTFTTAPNGTVSGLTLTTSAGEITARRAG